MPIKKLHPLIMRRQVRIARFIVFYAQMHQLSDIDLQGLGDFEEDFHGDAGYADAAFELAQITTADSYKMSQLFLRHVHGQADDGDFMTQTYILML